MELELKAYKVAWPSLFQYTGDFWNDPDQYGIIYGINQKRAVNDYCMSVDSEPYYEVKKHIRTRRFKEADRYSQKISPLLKDLSKQLIYHLTHSLGVEVGGICPDEYYRNYSAYYTKHEDCEKLVKLGLMKQVFKFDQFVYHVTKKGQEAVKTLLLITK